MSHLFQEYYGPFSYLFILLYMSEKETEKKIDIKTVKKEIEKISVIDSTNVSKLTLKT